MPKQANDALEKFAELARSERSGRMAMASEDTRYMCLEYFGQDLWPCQQAWDAQLDDIHYGGIVGAPGVGKTELLLFKGTNQIIKNRNIRIAILGATEKIARKDLSVISRNLQNSKLVGDFGSFRTRSETWGKTAITVKRDGNLKDPTVEALGIGSNILGGRYDIIIADDPIDEKTVRSADRRKQTIEYLEGTLLERLEPWGIFWVLGNRKHPDDLYNYLIKSGRYEVVTSRALIREPEYSAIELPRPEPSQWNPKVKTKFRIVFKTTDRGEALTPERWPVERLLEWKHHIGSVLFNREYQGIVVDDETALIKREWLEAARDETVSYGVYDRRNYLGIISGCDPALATDKKRAEKNDTDFFVNTTVGIGANEHRYLLDLVRDRGMSPDKVEKTLINQARLHRPNRMFLEANAFGEIHHWNLKHKTGIPIKAHYTGGNKYDPYAGYPALSTLFENKQIHLPYKTDRDKEITDGLIEELYNPEECSHDDRLSSLWITECGVRWFLRVMDNLGSLTRTKMKPAQADAPGTSVAHTPPAPTKAKKRPQGVIIT